VPELPMYRRIADELRLAIESGQIAPGEQIPPEPELRNQHGASRNTIRDAIKWLISRGLVETRPGQGTFVIEKMEPFITTLTEDPETGFGGGEGVAYMAEVTASMRVPQTTEPQVEVQPAIGLIATELKLNEGEYVISRHQQRSIDERPWSLQTSYYPMDLVNRGALELIQPKNFSPGVVEYLRKAISVQQVGYRDRITVRSPDEIEASFFALPDDGRIAVFVTYRTAFDEKGNPFRLTESVFPADRNEFVINVGEIP
jgi:GntR family transcriptional regulator